MQKEVEENNKSSKEEKEIDEVNVELENGKENEDTFDLRGKKTFKKDFYLENNQLGDYTYSVKQIIEIPNDVKEKNNILSDVDCFSIQYEKNDSSIAAAFSDGHLAIFNHETGELKKLMKASEYPITCLRWKPYLGLKPKNILSSVTADGKIHFWHSTSGKTLYTLTETSPIMCMDFNNDGSLFAVAGNDKVVKLFDDNTKCLITKLKSKDFKHPGHSNRIFAVKFNKENDNILISGGWDNTLQVYDIREKNIVASIYGPHLCGDSIDIKGNKILTASWASTNQIQIFDLRKFKQENCFNLSNLEMSNGKSSFLYCCEFAKFRNETDMFGIAGSNENFFGCYDFDYKKKGKGDNTELRTCMKSKNNMKSAYALDFSYRAREFAIGSGDGKIHIVSYEEN